MFCPTAFSSYLALPYAPDKHVLPVPHEGLGRGVRLGVAPAPSACQLIMRSMDVNPVFGSNAVGTYTANLM